MSFSINTNISSLQAQSYLNKSSQFQAQTINRVTSGMRIVNSGDDAAGLAIANGFRSDEAVLNQGIQNGNNGLATLQTIDSGMNNVSTLLDRARTLATESASGTFTGDRGILNSEFQSVMSEINRQATSIGMNQGGTFAQALSVFIGGGKQSGNTTAIANGSVNVDLSKASVDTQSLGLTAFNAQNTGYDLGTGSTSVANILADATNKASESQSGYTQFTFTGVGFGDTNSGGTLNQNAVTINVNLAGVSDTNSLVSAINSAIQSTANTASANDAAFKNAAISAKIVTDSTGKQQLAFSSSTSAFQVQAGDKMASALLGSLAAGTTGNATTNATAAVMATGTQALMSGSAPKTFAFTALAAGETQAITFTTNDSSGKVHTATVSLTHANAATADNAIETINNQLQTQQDPVIGNMVAFKDAAGTDLTFASSGTPFTMTLGTVSSTSAQPTLGDGVGAAADQGKVYTSGTNGSASTVDISTATGAQNAVSALATAVQNLGSAQAAVGKGENTLNYAVSLATSQVTNEAAAESQIRDANLAQEAANLSKAQILVQAGTAALAQANSAPQQLLSLLKG